MRKNIDKWNHYLGILEDKADQFIDQLGRDIPEVFYEVSPAGNITECKVHKLTYRFRDHDIKTYFSGKRPTREQVADIKKASERELDFRWEFISIHYKYSWGDGNTARTAVKYGDLLESEKFFLDKDNAAHESERIKAEKKKEEELLSNGHIRCTYCRDIVPEDDAVTQTMHNIKMYGRGGKIFQFCSGRCATHNQMSLEG